MKILIAIFSCSTDRCFEEQARETWLQNCPVDYKFFLGKDQKTGPAPDEIFLDCEDDYAHLPFKTQGICRYTIAEHYDYVFKGDIDTYVCVPRLLASGFENFDYSGYGEPYGGSGYWLSRRAAGWVANSPFVQCDKEDQLVHRILYAQHIKSHQDPRYHSLTAEGPAPGNDIISAHQYAWITSDGVFRRRICSVERLAKIRELHKIASEIKS